MQLIDSERLDILKQLAEDDPTFLTTVINAFLPQLRSIPNELRNALAAEDLEALARQAHSLKGSASNLGAEAVRECCMRIEHTARNGETHGIAAVLDELQGLAEDTARYFERQRG